MTHTKLILTFLLFTFLSTNLFAQYPVWVQRYDGPVNGDDRATFIAVDDSGNVFVTGYSPGNGTGKDCATIKYNPLGVQQWVQRYNGPGNGDDIPKSIGVDGFGNVYVAGSSMGSGTGWDCLTIKYNSAGIQQWVQRYNGTENLDDELNSMAVDYMGNVYVTGYRKYNSINSYYVTIKYNSAGVQQWIKIENPLWWVSIAHSIALDSSGNVYVTGETGGGYDTLSGENSDIGTYKYDSSGVMKWGRWWGFINYAVDRGLAIAVDKAGNSYIVGISSPAPGFDIPLVLKYNSLGNLMWEEFLTYRVIVVEVDNFGHAYTAGEWNTNYVTGKFGDTHNAIWWRFYNNGLDAARSIAVDDSSNVYVTGYSTGSGTDKDYATIKYDSSGVEQWVLRYNGPVNGGDVANSISVDNLGNVCVTGYSLGNGTSNDYATIKYSPNLPPLPAVPLLISPPNNAVGQGLNLSLVWNPVAYASTYRLQLATDTSFTNIILEDSTLTNTVKAVTNLNPLTDYYWRVNAKNIIGTGPFSSVWHFKTHGSPTQVNLLYPQDDTTNIPVNVNFIWNKPGEQTYSIKTLKRNLLDNPVISKYWFELTTDTSGTPLIIDSTLTDTTKLVSGLNNLISYYWHVKAKNETGWGVYSAWFKFTTVSPPPLAPVLVSPPNGATLVELNPLLDWDSSVYAESYRVQVSVDFFVSTVYDSNNIVITEFQIPNNGLNINTTYSWRVSAANVAGTSPWSIFFLFTTGTTNITLNSEIPKEFKLYNSYPNPFNPSTKIKFDIPKASYVKLIIYDVLGREITTLVNEKLNAGRYEVSWPAPTGDGSVYPSGVYFYKLIADEYVSVKKMLMIK